MNNNLLWNLKIKAENFFILLFICIHFVVAETSELLLTKRLLILYNPERYYTYVFPYLSNYGDNVTNTQIKKQVRELILQRTNCRFHQVHYFFYLINICHRLELKLI
jgi:hypothetical protein